MSTLVLVVFGIGAAVCWRLVTWHIVDEAHASGSPDDEWAFALFVGFVAACVWPFVLIFWRPRRRDKINERMG